MELIMIAIGFFIGVVVACIGFLNLKIGKLRIDRSIPKDGPYMFLELSKGVESISGKHYVVLEVKNENFISQK